MSRGHGDDGYALLAALVIMALAAVFAATSVAAVLARQSVAAADRGAAPVSYTHLTLPTIYSV